MAVSLQATMAYPYAGRSLRVGDRFEASEKDAALLKILGRAVDAPVLRTKVLLPEPDEGVQGCPSGPEDEKWPSGDSEPAVEHPRTKRQYRRRDLTVEH